MKLFPRILAIVLAAMLALISLSACGSNADKDGKDEKNEKEDKSEESVKTPEEKTVAEEGPFYITASINTDDGMQYAILDGDSLIDHDGDNSEWKDGADADGKITGLGGIKFGFAGLNYSPYEFGYLNVTSPLQIPVYDDNGKISESADTVFAVKDLKTGKFSYGRNDQTYGVRAVGTLNNNSDEINETYGFILDLGFRDKSGKEGKTLCLSNDSSVSLIFPEGEVTEKQVTAAFSLLRAEFYDPETGRIYAEGKIENVSSGSGQAEGNIVLDDFGSEFNEYGVTTVSVLVYLDANVITYADVNDIIEKGTFDFDFKFEMK